MTGAGTELGAATAAFEALAALDWDEIAVDTNGYRPGGATRPDEFVGPDPSKDR